jgi:hypothetical protein
VGSLSPRVIVLAVAAILVWIAGTALDSWRAEQMQLPWSAIALGFLGAGLGVLQTPATGGPLELFRASCVLSSFATAVAIWLGLLVRDLSEIRASA